MKCFTHQAKDAVGVCNVCSKGICSECASDLDHSIACKSSCEEQAHLLDPASKLRVSVLKTAKFIPVFAAIMGLVFIYFGIERYPRDNFSIAVGIGFLAFAGIHSFALRKRTPVI